MKSFPILGVAVDLVTLTEATELILRWARSGRGMTRQVITVNPEELMVCERDPEFLRIMSSAALRTADGMGVRFAGEFYLQTRRFSRPIALTVTVLKALGFPERLRPFPQVVTGADLLAHLLPVASVERLTCFLLGSSEQTLNQLSEKLRRQYPELRLTLHPAGKVSSEGEPNDRTIIKLVAEHKPHLLFTSLGSPKGQRFIRRYEKKLNARVAIEVGGAFPYLASTVSRAPLPLRRRGFEWLWRLVTQPWRWNRVLTATLRFVRAVYQSSSHP